MTPKIRRMLALIICCVGAASGIYNLWRGESFGLRNVISIALGLAILGSLRSSAKQ
jgi:hypothetical protein